MAKKAEEGKADFLHKYTVEQLRNRLNGLDAILRAKIKEQAESDSKEENDITKVFADGFADLENIEKPRINAEKAAIDKAKADAEATRNKEAAAAIAERARLDKERADAAAAAVTAAAEAAAAAAAAVPGGASETDEALVNAKLKKAIADENLEVANANQKRLEEAAKSSKAAAEAAATAAATAATTAATAAAAAATTAATATAAEAVKAAAAPAPTTYLVTIRIPKKDFDAFLAEPSRTLSKVTPTLTWTNPPNTDSVTLGNQHGTFVIKIGDCITATRPSTTLAGTFHIITAKITDFVDVEDDPAPNPKLYYRRYTSKGTWGDSNTFFGKNSYNSIKLLDKCPDT
jgi:hypothetical protein